MIFLLFNVHLFKNIDNLKGYKVYLIEEPRYMTDFQFHKLKLAYHRATMKKYYNYLIDNKISVKYIEYKDVTDSFYSEMKDSIIAMYDPNDFPLESKLKKIIKNIKVIDSLNFLLNRDEIIKNKNRFFTGKSYNNQNFYKWQRIKLNILIDKSGKPIGNKWSFDKENRKKLPKNVKLIPMLSNNLKDNLKDKYIEEAKIYVEKNFPNNYGSLDHFIYPIDHEESMKWLIFFLKNKFEYFGIYEDAVLKNSNTQKDNSDEIFLFHSVLTPMMNIGLITDREVIIETMKYINKIPLNSFEGFIRQIIGWRNYIYSIYVLEYDKIPKMNFFGHNKKLNKKIMWHHKGKNSSDNITMIDPIDDLIEKIIKYAYVHHIERLMYLGNYMLLKMYKPKDVYEIFMEWTIDSYDWVMMANVYCMSQYADGGLVMTKPYFCSSKYILRMSNYKKGDWSQKFDAIYYNFINNHIDYLSKNYGTARQVAHWKKKSAAEKQKILKLANID
jgi:deoxyribodipyrimidine photolyase-related protein